MQRCQASAPPNGGGDDSPSFTVSRTTLDALLLRLREAEEACDASTAAVATSTASVRDMRAMIASIMSATAGDLSSSTVGDDETRSLPLSDASPNMHENDKSRSNVDPLVLTEDALIVAMGSLNSQDTPRTEPDEGEDNWKAAPLDEDNSFRMMPLSACVSVPICHPASHVHIAWLWLTAFCIVYDLFAIPVDICFGPNDLDQMSPLVDSVILFGMLVTCFTAVETPNGDLIFTPKMIMHIYFRGWLFFDLLSCTPWSFILADDSVSNALGNWSLDKIARGLRVLRALRLLKVKRLLTGSLEKSTNQLGLVLNLATLLLPYLLFVHWIACFWYLMGVLGTGAPTATGEPWLIQYTAKFPLPRELYMWCLYYALVTVTTIGYGDIHPQTFPELCFSVVVLPLSSVGFAYMMGSISETIIHYNRSRRAIEDKRANLNSFLSRNHVPTFLRRKIRVAVAEDRSDSTQYDGELIDVLPTVVREELCLHQHYSNLVLTPILQWLRNYPLCLRKLAVSVKARSFSSAEYMFVIGQPNATLHIIIKGSLKVYNSLANQSEEYDYLQQLPKDSLRYALWAVRVSRVRVQEEGPSWNRIQQSSDPPVCLMKQSVSVMEAEAKLLFALASSLQRRWRSWISRRRKYVSTLRDLPRGGSPKQFQKVTVIAPAYLGDSWLWLPISSWSDEAHLPRHSCTARFLVHGEVLDVPRSAILRVLQEFEPWLPARFARFQKLVGEQAQLLGFSKSASSSLVCI